MNASVIFFPKFIFRLILIFCQNIFLWEMYVIMFLATALFNPLKTKLKSYLLLIFSTSSYHTMAYLLLLNFDSVFKCIFRARKEATALSFILLSLFVFPTLILTHKLP